MDLEYCEDDIGRAYYTRGLVPFGEFMAAVAEEVELGDILLAGRPEHRRIRITRDFEGARQMITPTDKPGRGAFWVTWVDDMG